MSASSARCTSRGYFPVTISFIHKSLFKESKARSKRNIIQQSDSIREQEWIVIEKKKERKKKILDNFFF
jgi:hypothetical protein